MAVPPQDNQEQLRLTPALLRQAYRAGLFPMAESRHGREVDWYAPQQRALLPLAGFHVPRRLRRLIFRHPFHVTFNRDFSAVIEACADARQETWINDEIIAGYKALHTEGGAQSVEVWTVDAAGGTVLAGGLYGVSLGGAFFGESMFSRVSNASKIALVFLAARLWRRGYGLLDAQFFNPHLTQFGLVEVPQEVYLQQLEKAAVLPVSFGDVYSPLSNELGSSSSAGTASRVPPATGSSGDSVSGVAAGGAGRSAGRLAAASSREIPGAVSSEYAESFADVAVFLQERTQTS